MSLEKIWYFLFSNYMWLYLISGICTTILGLDMMTYRLFMTISFIFFLTNFSKIKITNILDLFVVLFFVWILINSLTIDYPNHGKMWIQALVTNIFPLSFYFLAKCTSYNIESILKRATLPMVIAMVFGLIFYYTEPGWYTAIKMRQIYARSLDGNIRDEQLIEYFRLSSFWVTPYVIGYASMLFADFNLHKIFSNISIESKYEKWKHFILLVLCGVVIFLTQFRATIYMLIITTVYLMFFAKNKIKLSYIVIVIVSGIMVISLLLNDNSETGAYYKERMMKGLDSEQVESRLEYTGGGVDLTTLNGNGFGRYGSNAANINKEWPMVDSEYQKILAELGIIGFIPFLGLVLTGLMISCRKKQLQLEFIIVLFFAFAFIGSSCLSVATTFPFIFWYVLGQISKKSRKIKFSITRF